MSFENKRIVWLSVHDAAPAYTRELQTISEGLISLDIPEWTFLVIPAFRHRENLSVFPDFCAWLLQERASGRELALHGLYHDYAEFKRMGYDSAKSALRDGMAAFESVFANPPLGFVAPQWMQSKGSLRAVWEAGFRYTETLNSFRIADGRIFSSFPLNYDWGIGVADRLFSAWNGRRCRTSTEKYLRFAIHPMDVRNGLWPRILEHLTLLKRDGWQFQSYSRFCAESL